jgi:transcriptional regulator with XRE-family HTH domain
LYKASQKEQGMTQRDMAGVLGVDVKTLRNWRKDRPELYRRVVLGFKVDEAAQEARRHYENLKRLAEGGESRDHDERRSD